MARRQYRIASTTNWTSNYGYAFLALVNQSGSGRKLVLRELSCFVLSHKGATPTTCTARLYRAATPFAGEDMTASRILMDSSVSFPSGVVVRRSSMISAYSSVLQRVDLGRRSGAVGTQNNPLCCGSSRSGPRGLFGGTWNRGSVRGTTALEAITLPQNTGVALVVDNSMTENQPVRINVVARIDGRTAVWNFVSVPIPGIALWSLENTGTATVTLLNYSISELGTVDTPYIRIVPIGQNYARDLSDTSKQNFTITKMDSTYPDLTPLKIFSDIGFIPSGTPEVAINEASAGAPKFVNYLHTRDFNGPTLRAFLPEMRAGSGVGGNPIDMLGHANSHHAADMLTRVSGSDREAITINPGEGVALVATSETFIGVQGAYSGWPSLEFAAQIDSLPTITPTLTLTGLKNPTEVRIYSAGTTTQLAGQENVTSGTFSWSFDSDLVSSVDISILSLGYQNLRILGVSTTGDVNIPVQQQLDRQYLNP